MCSKNSVRKAGKVIAEIDWIWGRFFPLPDKKRMSNWGPYSTAQRSLTPAQKLLQGTTGKKANKQTKQGKGRDTVVLQFRWYWIFGNNFFLQARSTFLGQFWERSTCLELLNTTIYAGALKTKPELVICKFCSCFAIKVCDQECNVHKVELILFLHVSYFGVPITTLPKNFILWSLTQKLAHSRSPNSFWKQWN